MKKHLRVQFLGHVIDCRGIHVDPDKIESIKDWASPKHQQRFANFWAWSAIIEDSSKGFQRSPMTSDQSCLNLRSEDFIAYCDASKKGLGAVLMQREKNCCVIDDRERKILYHPGRRMMIADALKQGRNENH
ncbi:hypothetical protein Tco_0534636 [Tanacetum coccineum]